MLQPIGAIVGQPWALERAELQRVADSINAGTLVTAASPSRNESSRRDGVVAVISVQGMIEHRGSVLGEIFGGTSIESLRTSFRAALSTPDVSAIVLDIDSPGGSVAGVTELAQEIRAARGQKPILAVANTTAASAAYWLGSQADEFYASPSAQVGSIGVLAVHEDHSEELAAAGVKVSIISAGEMKGKGTSATPLDDESRAAMQRRVDAHYDQFIADVAAGRRVKASDVREGYGKGDVLMAQDALDAGLVDGIATLDTVIRQVARATRATRAIHAADDSPEPRAEQDEPDETVPFRIRVQNLATDAALVAAHAEVRAALRAKEGRPAFHPTIVEQLRSTRDALSALLGPDEPAESVTAEQPDEPPEPVEPVKAQPAPPPRFQSSDAWAQYVHERLIQ